MTIMDNRVTVVQNLILLELVKASSYLYIFTLSKRLRLDVYAVNMAMKKLLNLGFVETHNDADLKIRITNSGYEWFMKNSLHFLNNEKPWRKCPTKFSQHQMKPNDFYVPLHKNLDKKFFQKYSIKGGNKAGG